MPKLPPRETSFKRVPTLDDLNAVSRNDVARVAFKGIDIIERELPEHQVHGTAVMFLAICERIGTNPRTALERAERILAARHQLYDRNANMHFAALSDFVDHCHDPVKSVGIRHEQYNPGDAAEANFL